MTAHLAFAISLWLIASSVLVSVFLAAAADAQTYIPYWDPDVVRVLESDRTVALTLKKGGPGHVHYQTEDSGRAQAPGDYQAVSGDLIFTEAGTRTVSITIVDDNLEEDDEDFWVAAHEGDRRAGGWTGRMGRVWILDDDHPEESSGGTASSGQSNQPGVKSKEGSSSRTTTPQSAVAASPGSADPGNQSGEATLYDPTPSGEPGAGDDADPLVGEAARNDDQGTSPLLVDLATLLLVTVAIAAFVLKKKLGRAVSRSSPLA